MPAEIDHTPSTFASVVTSKARMRDAGGTLIRDAMHHSKTYAYLMEKAYKACKKL